MSLRLYDSLPGGAGLSAQLYDIRDELLHAALDRVRDCPCSGGCPACVGPAGDVEPGTKTLTERLLVAVTHQGGESPAKAPSGSRRGSS
ncbi:MAG: DUF1998 domain-containing protein [Armatimonadota bacterium]